MTMTYTPDAAHGGHPTAYRAHPKGGSVAVLFDAEFSDWRALHYSAEGELLRYKDFEGDTPESKSAAESWE